MANSICNVLFQPRIGENYNDGINGKKMLVLGASFYCDESDCKFFKDCTDEENPQTTNYDQKCPSYGKIERKLSESAQVEIDSFIEDDACYKSYCNFTHAMYKVLNKCGCLELCNRKSFWDYVAFTNYIQFMLPHKNTLKKNAAYQNNIEALKGVISKLKPDILCVWGCVINDFVCDGLKVKQREYVPNCYLGDFDFKGKSIVYINPYHPSSSNFKRDENTFVKYMFEILK